MAGCLEGLDFSKYKPHNFSAGLPPALAGVAVSIATILLARSLLLACKHSSIDKQLQPLEKNVDVSQLSVLDPCCGSGTVVYEAWKRGLQVLLLFQFTPAPFDCERYVFIRWEA